MFRPAIQKLYVLILMALFCLSMVIISFNSKFIDKKPYYSEKVIASKYMNDALKILKTESVKIFKKEPDSSFDPLKTGLVFFEDDLEGNLNSKLTTLNPNFAALVIDLIIESGLRPVNKNSSKDIPKIAIAFTGSMPGANLAVLSACYAMGFDPVIISSMSASNFGALKYDRFSWLDMEYKLSRSNSIYFINRSVAASRGKGRDSGFGLEESTIKLIDNSIIKYSPDIRFLYNEGSDLSYYIDERMKIYDQENDNAPYDLFINVGGGVASIGYYPGIKKISGFLSIDSLNTLYNKKLINNCVMSEFASRDNNPIPAINIIDIESLIKDKLPLITLETQKNSISVGEGSLFTEKKYNISIVIPCLIASLIIVLSVGIFSHFQIKKRMTSYEPDSIS